VCGAGGGLMFNAGGVLVILAVGGGGTLMFDARVCVWGRGTLMMDAGEGC